MRVASCVLVLALATNKLVAATNTGPVCAILNPIVESSSNPIVECACDDSTSGVGGAAACRMMVPSAQPITLIPATEASGCIGGMCAIPAQDAVVISPVQFRIGTEVLPCGDPASVAVHGEELPQRLRMPAQMQQRRIHWFRIGPE